VTGVARSTIGRGLAELRIKEGASSRRIRRPGGGRKPKVETEPGLLDALADLVQSAIRGDPEAALLWVSKSQRHLAAALSERGFTVSQKLVGRLLRRLGFSLQANRKTREGTSHPDRNAQFEHINAQINAFQAAGQPTISVDTKKKELVGDFKNGGRELRPKGDPESVRVHDFMLPELGKVAPYGVYDIAANAGWINLGITSDTAAFAVAWHRADECSRRLAKIPGVGPIGAVQLTMKTPDPKLFKSGRQFAAWIGLTPKDHSTGGKLRLGVITRAGDDGLRSVLVVGATAVTQHAQRSGKALPWLAGLLTQLEQSRLGARAWSIDLIEHFGVERVILAKM
jgi:transposase